MRSPPSLPEQLLLRTAFVALVALQLATPRARAQDAGGTPAVGAASASASATTTENDEDAAFEGLAGRMETTVVPPDVSFPEVFVLNVRYVAPKPKKKEVVETTVPNADIVKKMFQAVRVSSISITASHRIAVVAKDGYSLRVHPGETVLGAVQVKEIEKDRVLFQYTGMPPIWIYRVRPGMPAPEVVAQQQQQTP